MDEDIHQSDKGSISFSTLTGGRLGAGPVARSSRVSILDRWVARKLLDVLGHPPLSFVLWNGEVFSGSDAPTLARVHFRDSDALHKLLLNPPLNFGDFYSNGRIEVEGNLVDFLVLIYQSTARSPKYQKLKDAQMRLFNRPSLNNLSDSRDNIHHHYDLGNDFYRLWLDADYMQYTCGYYPEPNLTLEAAQRAKMHHICRKLRLKPGDRVVEAGSGWGGFARYMAKYFGVHVKSYNVSHQQVLHARKLADAQQLSGRVEYVEDDYRHIDGQYDVFVSVGMLEHVGRDHYREMSDVIHRCLVPGGRGLIHSIGRNRPEPLNPWIEKRIFPGGYPPALKEMMEIFEPNDFSVLDVENLRLHYAKTLYHWSERFEQHANAIEKMYDTAFVRAWRLYLAGSIAGFTAGTMQLFQILFSRGANNDLPWSRHHLYHDS